MKNNSGSYYGSSGICLTLWSNSTLCFKSKSSFLERAINSHITSLRCILFLLVQQMESNLSQ